MTGGGVAIVTGGGRGIGRVLAQGLAADGWSVGLVARTAEQLQATAGELEQAGHQVAFATADVTDEAQLRAAVDELVDRLGPVDLMVNNAGAPGPTGPAWEVDPEEWWRATEVNLRSVLLGCRVVIPSMIERGGGRIVNITSEAGVHRWPTMSAYSASKAAVVKFTENVAVECRGTGVAIFSMHPGLTPIGFSEQTHYLEAPPGSAERRLAEWVLGEFEAGRGADPAMSADLVVRLASGVADGLSGCHVSVHDDLDALVADAAQIRRGSRLTLRLR